MTSYLGHILVVDDEVDLANILTEAFELENFQVTECHSADDALKNIEFINPDIVISDAHMPGMNGMDFLRELRSRVDEDKIKPFFFYLCTGDMEITEEELIEAGGTGLISKPYDLFDLLEIIKEKLSS